MTAKAEADHLRQLAQDFRCAIAEMAAHALVIIRGKLIEQMADIARIGTPAAPHRFGLTQQRIARARHFGIIGRR